MELHVDNQSVEKIVQEQIRIAVAQALAQKTEYLVERIVHEALDRKDPNAGYGRRENTVIQNLTDDMVRQAAQEAAKQWLDEQRPKVQALVKKRLNSESKGLIAKVAEQLVAKFGEGIDVSVYFKGA